MQKKYRIDRETLTKRHYRDGIEYGYHQPTKRWYLYHRASEPALTGWLPCW